MQLQTPYKRGAQGAGFLSVRGLLLALNSNLNTLEYFYNRNSGLAILLWITHKVLHCQKWPLSGSALWMGAFISFWSEMALVNIRCS